MCTNYVATSESRYADLFDSAPPDGEWPAEIYCDYPAPFIRRGADGGRESLLGSFGIRPQSKIGKFKFDTMNARSETVGQKASFKDSWHACRFAIVPADVIYEPRYPALPDLDTPVREELVRKVLKDKSERWAIELASGAPCAVAGLWKPWPEPDGSVVYGFTMLTVNADGHPFLSQFHRHLEADGTPNEKRGVVILMPEQYDDWLNCREPEQARSFLSLLPAEAYRGRPAPRPPRRKKQEVAAPGPANDELF
ncbi:SOS response-associated peptidase [Burkholderia gladioli]|uniref:SOS response-associated peptidase n=1 Tax=Burkholderia gladioli TaxID=28095 RepID=UPI0016413F17|nr:SOS response-associated peptidase family protein [Burkholderia gladioli]